MSETQQTSQLDVFGDVVSKAVEIETTGRVIRPFARMIGQVAGEHRLEIDSDGIHVLSAGAANVGMIDVTLHAEALERLEFETERQIGVSMSNLGKLFQHARYGKRTNDRIRLEVDGHRGINSHVTKDIDGTPVTFRERAGLIDPDSIRASPDIPELEFSASAQISPQAFVQAITAGDWNTVVWLDQTENGLAFYEEDDHNTRSVELETESREATAHAGYSKDYMTNFARGIENGLVETVMLRWGEEYPLEVWFDRPGVYTGRYMMAPRIQTE